jgi:hypothetical protein
MFLNNALKLSIISNFQILRALKGKKYQKHGILSLVNPDYFFRIFIFYMFVKTKTIIYSKS